MHKLFLISVATFAMGAVSFAEETPSKSEVVARTDAVAAATTELAPNSSLQPAISAGVSTKSENPRGGLSGIDRVYFGVTSTFHGAPLRNIDSKYSVDRAGKEQQKNYNALLFDSEIGSGYRLSKTVGVGVVVPFLAFVTRQQGFVLGDVGIKAYNSRTFNINGAHVATNLILQVPTSDSSRARGQNWALKTTPSIRYAVPRSNFTLGSWTEAKSYFGVEKDKTFKLWALPYVNYAFNDSLSLNIGYELEYHHDVGMKGFGLNAYQTDLQTGVIIGVAKGVFVNPYVAFYTMEGFNSDRAAVGAFLSASIL